MEEQYKQAAEWIQNATFLLFACGAGFSADSNLATYTTILEKYPILKTHDLSYAEMARPEIIFDSNYENSTFYKQFLVEKFFAFWLDSMHVYDKTKEHDGYTILKNWKDKLFPNTHPCIIEKMKQSFPDKTLDQIPSNFFIYTSNVDHHFARQFSPHEIFEIHGHVFQWQCSAPCHEQHYSSLLPHDFSLWNLHSSELTIQQLHLSSHSHFHTQNNRIYCSACNNYARPNVLMFGNDSNKYIYNETEEMNYVSWECGVETALRESAQNELVILEIGCGKRVPSVRLECEQVLYDIWKSGAKAKLIRINPIASDADYSIRNILQVLEEEEYSEDEIVEIEKQISSQVLCIQDTAVHSLQQINSYLF